MGRSIQAIIVAIVTCAMVGVPALALSQTEQTRLTAIVTKGDQEIARRLTALNSAASVIDKASKLSSSNKQILKDEVTSATTGLTALKTRLDADVTLADARADAKSITADYRVYALVLPKVRLVKVSDSQISLAASFDELSTKFIQKFAELKTAGEDTSSLEATLANMNIKVANAKSIATTVQTKAIALQPSDYNSDHAVLAGDRDQLKVAHGELTAARTYAKTIIDGIKQFEQK